ncbi:carboxymuconolactone decarboxylase family protein [Cuniculiplasma sp. SKW3]|uniref:carboxymuconolactone decarboxylase family protein n=1 Tax=unclassified Cuniculiplasma TaxID=2619706 RepID=UPI003FD2555A
MNDDLKKIDSFAKSAIGETPEIVEILGIIDREFSDEQFRENMALYLGRKTLSKKLLSLIALGVSIANGQKESIKVHFELARNQSASDNEILDVIKVVKMALMSSTLSTVGSSDHIFSNFSKNYNKNVEVDNILMNVTRNSGMEEPPKNLSALSKISFDLLNEHIREKTFLLSPVELEKKYTFLIAYAISVSIRDPDCASVYLQAYFNAGGKVDEAVDAIAVSRFITGNKALTYSADIMKLMINPRGRK